MPSNESLSNYNWLEGEMLLIDKPIGWTSFDVVNKVRYSLKSKLDIKKIKVGHAGTLDPLATGLLILCTGKSTKKLESYQAQYKEYTGSIVLGATTPSYDRETEIDQQYPIDHINQDLLEQARLQFIGRLKQLPPMFSAIKVDGVPLYKKARNGIKVEVKPRDVEIFDFDLMNWNATNLEFRVRCSKGTYIRSLAYDFGKAVRSGGYLGSLCRTKIGEYKIEDAWNLEKLIEQIGA